MNKVATILGLIITICTVQALANRRFSNEFENSLELQIQKSMVVFQPPQGLACRGVLISEYKVVTAAHCNIFDKDPIHVELKSFLGDIRMTGTLVVHSDAVHKDFINDVAVIYLDQKISPSEFLAPVLVDLLPPRMKEMLVFDGWKKHNYFTLGESALVYGKVKKFSDIVESKTFEVDFLFGGRNCAGHSGGPVYRVKNGNIYLVGILSYGIRNDRNDWAYDFLCSKIGGVTMLYPYQTFLN
jgi:hypothetical protein